MIGASTRGQSQSLDWADMLRAVVTDATYRERIDALEARYLQIQQAVGGKDRIQQADALLAQAKADQRAAAVRLAEAQKEASEMLDGARESTNKMLAEAQAKAGSLMADAQAKHAEASRLLKDAEEQNRFATENAGSVKQRRSEAEAMMKQATDMMHEAKARVQKLREVIDNG